MSILGTLFYRQGRLADAKAAYRAVLKAYTLHGYNCSALDLNLAYHGLAKVLLALDRPGEALEQFQTIAHNMRHTPRIFKLRFASDPDWAYALLAAGDYSRAETMLAGALQSARRQYGGKSPRTAEIMGLLAVAQFRQSKTGTAQKNFQKALPVLLQHQRESIALQSAPAAFNRRLDTIIENYLVFVSARQPDGDAAARITFPLADVMLGQSVQQAVVASSLRMAANNPHLAELVRNEQDSIKKIGALKPSC